MKPLIYAIVACGMIAVLLGSCGSLYQMYDHWTWKATIEPEVERLIEKYDADNSGGLSNMERTFMGLQEGKIQFEYVPDPLIATIQNITAVFAGVTAILMGIHAILHRDEIVKWARERMAEE